MPGFEQKTVVRSYKLKIQNKFKCLTDETESVIEKLRSCISTFNQRLTEVVYNNDENFFNLYQNLDDDFEKYQEKLCYLLASFENPVDSAEEEDSEISVVKNEYCTAIGERYSPSLFNHQIRQGSLQSTPSQSASTQSTLAQSTSTQTECKTILEFHTSSQSSSSFCSLQDACEVYVLQPTLYKEQETISSPHHEKYGASEANDNLYAARRRGCVNIARNLTEPDYSLQIDSDLSNKSISHSSCYRSFSSNVSGLKSCNSSQSLNHPYSNFTEPFISACNESRESECFVQNEISHSDCKDHGQEIFSRQNLQHIFTPTISVPSVISATLTHIVNPGDFWMQLENSECYEIIYPMSQFTEASSPPYIEQSDFCLAPFRTLPFYYRAKVLSVLEDANDVEVLFIDHGSTQNIPLQNLRSLPTAAYEIPIQAIHCCLHEVSPINGLWLDNSIEKLKEYQSNCVEAHILSVNCDKYAVKLIATVSALYGEDFSLDIAEALCLYGLAISNGTSASEISNQISCDSGVSVTSNQRTSPGLHFSSDMMLADCSSHILSESFGTSPIKTCEKNVQYMSKYDIGDLMSFESTEEMHDAYVDSAKPQIETIITPKNCLRTADCDCALHLTIPPAVISFVEKDMMLVMLSGVISPGEFYVNLAMEESVTLDELREQMSATYESQIQDAYLIPMENLKEGIFCAGRYEQDGSWYRVKILKINMLSEENCDCLVQYIDYGNKSIIKASDLRSLTPRFVESPSFAIKCSLAGVLPKCPQTSTNCNVQNAAITWSEDSVAKFKLLTSYERCLTAQICETGYTLMPACPLSYYAERPLQVFLWDTEGTQDLLINVALVNSGVAEIDCEVLETLHAAKEVDGLNYWDPMCEAFNSIENSYGVHTEDFQVSISGYKPKDETYICKYFSLRGRCPRKHCPYEHVPLAEGGVTRDQEATYSLDPTPSLPSPSTYILIQVSAVVSPGIFYSILPCGNKSVDEIDARIHRGTTLEALVTEGNNGLRALFKAMRDYYSHAPFAENTAVSLAYGNIVAAWRKADGAWHRGRIIDVIDITKPAKVFFVDFGDEDWVPRRWIREILPEYLHTPFQAVECHLSDVEPLGFEQGKKWNTSSTNRFKELVANQILLARITYRFGKVLHLTLKKTTENDQRSISDTLVIEGFAQHVPVTITKKPESRYVPG